MAVARRRLPRRLLDRPNLSGMYLVCIYSDIINSLNFPLLDPNMPLLRYTLAIYALSQAVPK